jgi:hypothetical protein
VHAVHLMVLLQHGAICTQVGAEDHARHTLEAVDPGACQRLTL